MTKSQFHPFEWFTGDIDWVGYGGVWVHLIGNRTFHFIEWMPSEGYDDCKAGEGWVDLCEVELLSLSQRTIQSALNSCGWAFAEDGLVGEHSGDIIAAWDDPKLDAIVADCCRSYGAKAPLYDAHGRARVGMIRTAIRESKKVTSSATAHAAAMARPVNRLGSTAAEAMCGDIASAISRGVEAGDASAELMHHIYSKPGMSTLGGMPGIEVVYPSNAHEVLTPWEAKWRGTDNPRMGGSDGE